MISSDMLVWKVLLVEADSPGITSLMPLISLISSVALVGSSKLSSEVAVLAEDARDLPTGVKICRSPYP